MASIRKKEKGRDIPPLDTTENKKAKKKKNPEANGGGGKLSRLTDAKRKIAKKRKKGKKVATY